MSENIKITSDLFNATVKSMKAHHDSYVFQHNGNPPEYQQDMENILSDISVAYENGDDYITVSVNVLEGLVEQGLFKEIV